MKKLTPVLIFLLPFFSMAQNKEVITASKADTIITQDVLNPNREFWIIHNSKGVMKAQGYMLHGKREGMWREYNEQNGTIYKILEYEDDVLNGGSVTFNNMGAIQTDETYSNNKKNGQRATFNNYGSKIKLFENYKNDILEGTKRTFYEDGKIQEDGLYKNGQRNGVTKWYFQNGNPSMVYNYENGNLEGVAKIYNESGYLKQEGFYKNNNEEGEWKEYSDSVLVKKIIYKHGQILKEVPVKKK
jgi:antitoxin component YwqK of YwqJK toxin-antitoxin module